MNENLIEEERVRREERERKKAEVRARLEAAAATSRKGATKKRGGFITPERKKKLRLLLRRKAAEELKREQEVKANERRRIIGERVGEPKSMDKLNEDQVSQIIRQYHERLARLEDDKFELEYKVRVKDYEIAETTTRICDMRGKFVRPPLKKTPKYEAKIERMILNARKEIGFTVALKSVKKEAFGADDTKPSVPEWSWKNRDGLAASASDQPASSNSLQFASHHLAATSSPSPSAELSNLDD